jgi:TatD DNase family protein
MYIPSDDLQLVDSHCHLNQIDLVDFQDSFDEVLRQARANGVTHFLCVCVTREDVPALLALSARYPEISMSVGIHPNESFEQEISLDELIVMGSHPSCIAIGETGLDYCRVEEEGALNNQRDRFRTHIQAARHLSKPLIIHTRDAAEDTLRIMKEEKADDIGGVLHCFSESLDIAWRGIDLNFYISFSGILTFKNAVQLHEVAKKIPLDKILIETDSPYLAPVPFRGKQNHPALVKYVAQQLSVLRNVSFETIAYETTRNFYRCFFGIQ